MTISLSRSMQGYGSDFIRDMFIAARNPDLISFAGGAPAPDVYPLEAFRAASDRAFEEWGRTMMAYDGAEGLPHLSSNCEIDSMCYYSSPRISQSIAPIGQVGHKAENI